MMHPVLTTCRLRKALHVGLTMFVVWHCSKPVFGPLIMVGDHRPLHIMD